MSDLEYFWHGFIGMWEAIFMTIALVASIVFVIAIFSSIVAILNWLVHKLTGYKPSGSDDAHISG